MDIKYLALLLLFLSGSRAYSQANSINNDEVIEDNLAFRKEMNDYFVNPKKSPFPLFIIDSFEEAPYYEINLDYVVAAQFEPSQEDKVIKMKTSTDRIAEYKLLGKATFELKGNLHTLNVYKSPDDENGHLFLPFKDPTNGEGSYSAGRYLDIEEPKDGMLIIDFNKSYNPSCAYSDRYSCPRVPVDNHLTIDIPAGAQYLKKEDGWNELDVEPTYIGNVGADLGKIKYPKKARKAYIEGVVYVQMIVNEDGYITDYEIVRGVLEDMDEAALNAVKNLSRFNPGMKDGVAVRSRVILPISFKL